MCDNIALHTKKPFLSCPRPAFIPPGTIHGVIVGGEGVVTYLLCVSFPSLLFRFGVLNFFERSFPARERRMGKMFAWPNKPNSPSHRLAPGLAIAIYNSSFHFVFFLLLHLLPSLLASSLAFNLNYLTA